MGADHNNRNVVQDASLDGVFDCAGLDHLLGRRTRHVPVNHDTDKARSHRLNPSRYPLRGDSLSLRGDDLDAEPTVLDKSAEHAGPGRRFQSRQVIAERSVDSMLRSGMNQQEVGRLRHFVIFLFAIRAVIAAWSAAESALADIAVESVAAGTWW